MGGVKGASGRGASSLQTYRLLLLAAAGPKCPFKGPRCMPGPRVPRVRLSGLDYSAVVIDG